MLDVEEIDVGVTGDSGPQSAGILVEELVGSVIWLDVEDESDVRYG